jgi:thiol-disulfide isomerase/thioredoxin
MNHSICRIVRIYRWDLEWRSDAEPEFLERQEVKMAKNLFRRSASGLLMVLIMLVVAACDSGNGPAPLPTAAATAVSLAAPVKVATELPTTPTAIPAPMVGSRAPEIALNTYEGKPVTLSDTVKQHKATLVVFWAQWCGDCIQEMPLLDQAYQQYGKGGFQILGVNMADPLDKIAADVHSVSYPTLLDPNGVAAGAYWVSALPAGTAGCRRPRRDPDTHPLSQ